MLLHCVPHGGQQHSSRPGLTLPVDVYLNVPHCAKFCAVCLCGTVLAVRCEIHSDSAGNIARQAGRQAAAIRGSVLDSRCVMITR
jgi:hypothetical protein